MLTRIAAVPASMSRSPQLSVTIYSPNQSSPSREFRARLPGSAGRHPRAAAPCQGKRGH